MSRYRVQLDISMPIFPFWTSLHHQHTHPFAPCQPLHLRAWVDPQYLGRQRVEHHRPQILL